MTLLYFSPVRWESYEQRPHHFVKYFASATGARVVWIDPYPTRLPSLADRRRPQSPVGSRPPVPAGWTVLRPHAVPFEPLAAGRWLNRNILWQRWWRQLRLLIGQRPVGIGIGRPSDLARTTLDVVKPVWSFYDAMDDFPEFYSGRAHDWTRRCEAAIVDDVDVVLTSSSALWQKFESSGARRLMLRNAFDMDSLPAAAQRNGRPMLGYVGTVGNWFDWTTLRRLAETRPDAAVHIVGPRFVESPATLPANVTLFPECGEREAVERMQEFSAGLIPFRRTRLTEGVDPVKYYAYRAMGLPVLTTTFGEMAHRTDADGAYFLDSPAGLDESVRAALADRVSPAEILTFRAEHTWKRRFEESGLLHRLELKKGTEVDQSPHLIKATRVHTSLK